MAFLHDNKSPIKLYRLQLSTFVMAGHASWRVKVSDPINRIPAYRVTWNQFINNPCGFSVVRRQFWTFMDDLKKYPTDDSVSVSADGYIAVNDRTGGMQKSFEISSANVSKAVLHVQSLHAAPPKYVLHSNNCVDVCRQVADAAGIALPHCLKDVIIQDAEGKQKKAPISLPNELEKYLRTK